jgi:hypothetical protein
MSLEDELADFIAIPERELREKAEAAGVGQDFAKPVTGETVGFVISELVVPLLGRQREAILRLAHEVEELRAAHDQK